jgi:hypothetical protein
MDGSTNLACRRRTWVPAKPLQISPPESETRSTSLVLMDLSWIKVLALLSPLAGLPILERYDTNFNLAYYPDTLPISRKV